MVVAGSSGGGTGPTPMSFGVQFITGRWFMVYATLLIMAASGATYMFGVYSSDIKSSLGYSQTTLNMLSFFKDVGTAVGVPAGLLMEVTPPWVVLAVGAGLNFFGYFMIWLAVTGRIAKPAVWQMCLYICVGANSQAFSNTGALVTCVKNFPESRGVVLGLLKGFVGLSGAIITQLYHAVYDKDSKSLILFIGWLPTAISLAFLRTVRPITPVSNPNHVRIFYQLLYMSLALAGFLLVMILVQKSLGFSQHEYAGSAVAVVLLLCLPLYTVFRQERILRKTADDIDVLQQTSATETIPITESPKEAITIAESAKEEKVDGCFENVFSPPNRGENYTILQAFFSIDMLVLFTTTLAGVGGTLTAIDNLGQIGTSLGYPAKTTTTFVSLVSIWNYLGRVTAGFVSEYFLTKYKLPRPLMLTFVLLLSCFGHLAIASGLPNALYVASMVTGFCYGAQWPLLFAIISEIFGLKYYSTLYNFGSVASPIGNYILNVKITGEMYDKEARRQLEARGLTRKHGEELVCNGVRCFRPAFLIITAATVVAMFVSLILVWRTRSFYRSDIYKQFKEVGKEGETRTVEDGVGMVAVEGEEGIKGREGKGK